MSGPGAHCPGRLGAAKHPLDDRVEGGILGLGVWDEVIGQEFVHFLYAIVDFAWGCATDSIRYFANTFNMGNQFLEVGGQAVLGRQSLVSTPWLTERHGYDPTSSTWACGMR